MNQIIRKVYAVAALLSMAMTAHAATLLPNGKQQFVDGNGAPYASGSVCFYIPGTTTAKLTWQDALETTPNTTPCITLDSAGRAIIYGTGQYREELFDASSNLIWDQLTQDSPTLTPLYFGGTSTGTANAQSISLVGAMQPAALGAGQTYEFLAGATNTGATTLAVATSQFTSTATAIDKITSSGPVALSGGEIVQNNLVMVVYDGTRFELVNNPVATVGTLTATQIPFSESTTASNINPPVAMTAYVATGGLTVNLPLTTGLTKAFQFYVFAQGGNVTITPNIADKVQNGTAGVSYTLNSGQSAMLTTDANGNWWVFYQYTGGGGGGGSTGALHTQVFTGNGSFSAPATTTYKIIVTGAGGGGAGNVGSVDGSGGGGAGATLVYSTNITAGSSATVTIGAAGNGGASGNNNGTSGGASSVLVNGVTVTANGGSPGTFGGATAGAGGVGGTATGGLLNVTGGNGGDAILSASGPGAASYWGGGGAIRSVSGCTNGQSGPAYGSGGSGACGSGGNGGAGQQGVVEFEWVQ